MGSGRQKKRLVALLLGGLWLAAPAWGATKPDIPGVTVPDLPAGVLAPIKQGVKRYALVFGNMNYAGAGNLPKSGQDAQSMAEALRYLGFDDVVVLKNQSRDDMMKAIREFSTKLQRDPQALALVYFSGHGVQTDAENIYLMPTDFRLYNVSTLNSELDSGTVPMKTLLGLMGASRPGLNLVLMDGCRNNPWAMSFAQSKGFKDGALPASVKPSLSGLGGNYYVGYATSPDTRAWTGGDKWKHSIFTQRFLEVLFEKPGESLDYLFKAVQTQLRKDTKDAQIPDADDKLGTTKVLFMPPFALPKDQAAWKRAQLENSAAAYQAYLRDFPNGFYQQQAIGALSAIDPTLIPLVAVSAPEQTPPVTPPVPAPSVGSNDAVPPGSPMMNSPEYVLKICRYDYKAPIATYRASVDWGSKPPPRDGKKFVLAVKDIKVEEQSGTAIFWVQASYQGFQGKGHEAIYFNISDGPLYPFAYGLYEVTERAFKDYRDDCRQNPARCFVTGYAEGPNLLTNTVSLASAQETIDCSAQP